MQALHRTITAPEPGTVPDLVPGVPGSLEPDAALVEAVDAAMAEDVRVGVVFDDGPRPGHVYTYLAPPPVHVGSLVLVPPSIVRPETVTAVVDTLDPPPYHGPLKRVVAVLS